MKKALLLPLSVLAIASAAGCSAPLDPAIINPSSESGQSSQLDPMSIIERIEIKNLDELLADWHLGDAPRTIDLFTEPEVNILSYLQSGYLKVTVDDPSIIAINGLGVSALHEGTTIVRVSIGDKAVPPIVVTVLPEKTYQSVAATLEEVKDLEPGDTKNNIITRGVVTKITSAWSDQYGNVTFEISDEGAANKLLCYRAVPGEGVTTLPSIKVGDTVVLSGNVTNYNGTLEYATNSQVIVHEPGSGEVDPPSPVGEYKTVAKTLEEVASLEVGQSKDNMATVGIVSEVTTAWSDQYQNVTFKLKDEGVENELLCFRAKAGDGVTTLAEVKVGDKIQITGTIKNYQGTLEYDAGSLVTLHQGEGGAPIVEKATTIDKITEGCDVAISGVTVVGVTEKAFAVTDGTYGVYVFTGKAPEVQIGDVVNVTGKGALYHEYIQVSNPTVTKTEGTPVSLEPSVLDKAGADALKTAKGFAAAKLYTWEATAAKDGTYWVFNVEGSDTKIEPANPTQQIEEGKLYTVTAYFTAYDGKYNFANCVLVNLVEGKMSAQEVNISGAKEVRIGESINLTAKVLPAAVAQDVVWSSADESKATVDENGKVTGVAEGSVKIIANAKDTEVQGEYEITVQPKAVVPVRELSIAAPGGVSGAKIGETIQLTATLSPEDATNKGIATWTSSNPQVASVDASGLVTFNAMGEVKITATAEGKNAAGEEVKAEITLTTLETAPESVTISGAKEVRVEEEINLSASVLPAAAKQDVEWASSDPSKATVDANGKVTGLAEGEVKITATAKGTGVKAEYDIAVLEKATNPVTSVSISSEVTAAKIGETIQLTATVLPEDASTKSVSWTSSNPDVATVDANGLVTFKSMGEVTITATTNGKDVSGAPLTATIILETVATPAESVAIQGAKELPVGGKITLSASVLPAIASQNVVWSSADATKATVDADGVVTGVASGKVKIIATADGSEVKAEYEIEVKDCVAELSDITADSQITLTNENGKPISVTVSYTDGSTDSNVTWASSDATKLYVEDGLMKLGQAAESGDKITLTATTARTDASGVTLSKTIEVTIVDSTEPAPIEISIADLSAFTEDDTSHRYVVTGIAEDTYNGSFYLTDLEGHTVQAYLLVESGEWAYDEDEAKFTFTKAEGSASPENDALNGKLVTIDGTVKIYNGTVEINYGTYSIAEEQPEEGTIPAIIIDEGTVGGTYTVSKVGDAVFGEKVTISNVTPAEGYLLAGVKVNHSSYVVNLKEENGSYTFPAWTYNKIQVEFVNPSSLVADTIDQAIEKAGKLGKGKLADEYSRLAGTVISISGKNVTIGEGDKTFLIYDSLSKCGEAHVGDVLDVYGKYQNYNGTLEITQVNVIAITPASYTLSLGEASEHGTYGLSAFSGAYGETVTLTVSPASGYKVGSIDYAGKSIAVVQGQSEYAITLDRSGAITVTFIEESAAAIEKATMSYSGATANMKAAPTNNAATVGLDADIFTVTSAKNKCSNEVGLNKDGTMRLYSVASGDGCALTVDAGSKTILSIKITLASGSAAEAVMLVTAGDTTVEENDGVYTINASQFTIKNVTELGSKQIHISSIEITYQ